MRPDEQSATPSDPLDGFMIPGSWTRRVPTRPPGLEEFLAPSPVPNEPRSMDEAQEPRAEADASPLIAGDEFHKPIHQHPAMNEEWSAIAAIVAERPLVDEAVSEVSPAARTIADEAAALAAGESRALVAPADVFIEPLNRVPRLDDREAGEGGEALRALFDGEALVDSSPWFVSGREPGSSRESVVAPSFGPQSSMPTVASPFGWRASEESRESGPSSFPADRIDGSTPESFEEIEARLSRIAEKLEEAIERIGSTASEPLTARAGGFRGRVDE